MKKIIPHLFVGSISDYEALGPGILRYSILGACKEPLHRRYARMQGAEHDGYTLRAMSPDEPEYLWAERDHALYLNIVDARKIDFFPFEIFDKALSFIQEEIDDNRDVFIVCNKGESRSPSIALLYLIEIGMFNDWEYYWEVENTFRNRYYPEYKPGLGISEFCKKWWEER